jgi:hypothetical protein
MQKYYQDIKPSLFLAAQDKMHITANTGITTTGIFRLHAAVTFSHRKTFNMKWMVIV